MRLASIRRSRYWMNVTDIGEALHDLRPAVIDLIDLLEESSNKSQRLFPAILAGTLMLPCWTTPFLFLPAWQSC